MTLSLHQSLQADAGQGYFVDPKKYDLHGNILRLNQSYFSCFADENALKKQFAEFLQLLSENPQIDELEVKVGHLTDDQLKTLFNIPGLKTLILNDIGIERAGYIKQLALEKNDVEELTVRYKKTKNSFDKSAEIADAIIARRINPRLKKYTATYESDFARRFSFSLNSGYSHLSLSERLNFDMPYSNIRYVDDITLDRMREHLHDINEIDCANTGITSSGAAILAECTGLEVLNVSNTRIDDECIPKLLANKTLYSLDISSNFLTQKSREALKNSSLFSLNICDTQSLLLNTNLSPTVAFPQADNHELNFTLQAIYVLLYWRLLLTSCDELVITNSQLVELQFSPYEKGLSTIGKWQLRRNKNEYITTCMAAVVKTFHNANKGNPFEDSIHSLIDDFLGFLSGDKPKVNEQPKQNSPTSTRAIQKRLTAQSINHIPAVQKEEKRAANAAKTSFFKPLAERLYEIVRDEEPKKEPPEKTSSAVAPMIFTAQKRSEAQTAFAANDTPAQRLSNQP